MLDKAADKIKRVLPRCKNKAGQALAAAVIEYKSVVADFLLITDPLTLHYDVLRRKMAVLKEHYGLTDEVVDDLVSGAREKLGQKSYWALGCYEEPKQVVPPAGRFLPDVAGRTVLR
jgi:hypothetical protein